MVDWTKPAVGDTYTNVPSDIRTNFSDQAKMFDGATHTGTIPTSTVRWSSSNRRHEIYNGSAWVELVVKASFAYDIRVDTADKLNSQAASYYLDVGNMSAGTLAVARGGTSFTSYTIGDLIQASATGTLAKLAAVATGNVLISGGAGAASSWGKVGLTTHVSGTLALANGGTGFSSATAGYYVRVAAGGTALENVIVTTLKTDLSLVKGDVGLGNCDNTSDVNKPVSTATQTALDLKAPKSLTLNNQNAAYTLVAADNNKIIYVDDATGDDAYTVDNSVHAAGDLITIINDKSTSGNITLTQGSGFTIQWGTSTGTRTIARGGVVTLAFKTASKAWLTGSGIS